MLFVKGLSLAGLDRELLVIQPPLVDEIMTQGKKTRLQWESIKRTGRWSTSWHYWNPWFQRLLEPCWITHSLIVQLFILQIARAITFLSLLNHLELAFYYLQARFLTKIIMWWLNKLWHFPMEESYSYQQPLFQNIYIYIKMDKQYKVKWKKHNTNVDTENNLNYINFWRILKVNPEEHKQ